MTNEEAEAAKRSGNLPANYDNDVLRPYVDTLAIEAARALQFFLTSSAQGQLDYMLLAGGCASPRPRRCSITTDQRGCLSCQPFSEMGFVRCEVASAGS